MRQVGPRLLDVACFMVDTLSGNSSDGNVERKGGSSKGSRGSMVAGEVAGISVAAVAGVLA
jgi:hypothetical protein